MSIMDFLEDEKFFSLIMGTFAIVFLIIFTAGFLATRSAKKKIAMAPVQTVYAKCVGKEDFFKKKPELGSRVLFEFENGERVSVSANKDTAALIVAGDAGMLTYQAETLIKFERGRG